ncbi:uncharacterized protein LOC113218200 [Frankliniella occidentalis]|uniref:Uncharacterized protein LOC113218200 n=1 Tax=Frankliniella occidentalis TaxID=133901 RepID=A0A9C6X1D8_FRAOC|nr:uncharacterized protein LOC113218200 [Frankliniella occidentalis]
MLRASTKRKAVESLDARPAKVLRRCLGESQYENIDIGDTKLIRRSIYRQRRKNIPALPKSHDSALEAFRTMELTTKTGEKFVHVSRLLVAEVKMRHHLQSRTCAEKVFSFYAQLIW